MTAVRFLAITALILATGASAVCQTAPASGSPLRESVISGAASPQPISLTLLDAINRALKNNLAICYERWIFSEYARRQRLVRIQTLKNKKPVNE